MADKHESWREFSARFPGGLNWRGFVGYIRDDRVLKTRLTILVLIALLGVATTLTLVAGHLAVAAMCFVALLVVAFIGGSA